MNDNLSPIDQLIQEYHRYQDEKQRKEELAIARRPIEEAINRSLREFINSMEGKYQAMMSDIAWGVWRE